MWTFRSLQCPLFKGRVCVGGALSHCRRPADGRLSFASGSGALGTGYNRPQLEFKKYSPEANRQAIVGKVWRHWLKKKRNIKLSRIVTKGRDGGAGMKHYRNVILFPTTTKSESRQEHPQKRRKELFISPPPSPTNCNNLLLLLQNLPFLSPFVSVKQLWIYCTCFIYLFKLVYSQSTLSFGLGGTGYNRPQLEFKKYSPEANRLAIVGMIRRHWSKK